MQRNVWNDLNPECEWPGEEAAAIATAEELQALRLLTKELVKAAQKDEKLRRPWEEIQRAHDVVGDYCKMTNNLEYFHFVSALCWVLRHPDNTLFAVVIAEVEADLKRRGIEVVRLPELQYPHGRPQ